MAVRCYWVSPFAKYLRLIDQLQALKVENTAATGGRSPLSNIADYRSARRRWVRASRRLIAARYPLGGRGLSVAAAEGTRRHQVTAAATAPYALQLLRVELVGHAVGSGPPRVSAAGRPMRRPLSARFGGHRSRCRRGRSRCTTGWSAGRGTHWGTQLRPDWSSDREGRSDRDAIQECFMPVSSVAVPDGRVRGDGPAAHPRVILRPRGWLQPIWCSVLAKTLLPRVVYPISLALR